MLHLFGNIYQKEFSVTSSFLYSYTKTTLPTRELAK